MCFANKEREAASAAGEKESESRDVLIKGNSEGLDQIILHNLVREDTVFDSEKMEMRCPQRAAPPPPSPSETSVSRWE